MSKDSLITLKIETVLEKVLDDPNELDFPQIDELHASIVHNSLRINKVRQSLEIMMEMCKEEENLVGYAEKLRNLWGECTRVLLRLHEWGKNLNQIAEQKAAFEALLKYGMSDTRTKCIAIKDFKSEGTTKLLSVKKHDILAISLCSNSAWYFGENNGYSGYFPRDIVKIIPINEKDRNDFKKKLSQKGKHSNFENLLKMQKIPSPTIPRRQTT